MDVSLHNALLKVYISNNHQFSPSQFMEEMGTAGITPNQGTLSLLLDSYCQQGNLVGAQSLLQHMHEKGHHITEQEYASLISGHTQSGDMDGAWNMLEVMKENGFEPGIASYTALLRGHGRLGEVDRVRETLEKMAAKRIYPSHDVYIAILDSLSMGGHNGFITEVLDSISNKQWMLYDLVQLAQTCASRGEYESGLQLVTAVLNLPSDGAHLHSSLVRANDVIFHHMILSGQPVKKVFETLKKMTVLECVSPWNWEKLLFYTYQNDDTDLIVETIREMDAQGFVVKRHYLFPAFANYISANNLNGVKECIKLLNDLNLGLDQTIVQFLRFVAKQSSAVDLLALMKESGLLDREEEMREFIYHLCIQDLDALEDVVREIGLSVVGVEVFYKSLVDHCKKQRPDTVGLAGVFKMLYSASSSSPPSDELNKCVEDCAAELFRDGPIDAVQSFVTNLVDQGVAPLTDDTYAYAVSASGGDKKFVSFIEQQSVAVDTLKQHHRDAGTFMEPRISAEVRYLSNQIIKLAQAGRRSEVIRVYQTLVGKGHAPTFMAGCTVAAVLVEDDITTAEELLRELEGKGWVVNLYTRNAFIDSYSKRGDVENARRHYQRLLKSGMKPDHYTIWCLMGAYSFHGDTNMVQELIDTDMAKYGYELTPAIAGRLVEAHIYHGDLEAAVVATEKSSVLPRKGVLINLMKRLVAKKEQGLLDRVMAIAPFDKSQLTNILLSSYLACERTEEVRELIKSEDFEIDRIIRTCYGLALTGKVESIRFIIQLLQESDKDSTSLHTPLLKAYAHLGDVEGMMALEKELLEAGLKPSGDFSSILTRQLRRHGVSPPHQHTPTSQPEDDQRATIS